MLELLNRSLGMSAPPFPPFTCIFHCPVSLANPNPSFAPLFPPAYSSLSSASTQSAETQNEAPTAWLQAVRRMAWVRPKPKPADKLESVKWEDEKPSGYPWKNLKALTREKKVWLEHVTAPVYANHLVLQHVCHCPQLPISGLCCWSVPLRCPW